MKDLYRVFDHFKGIIRRADRSLIWELDEKTVWLTDGVVAFKVPKNEMELNPAMFKPFRNEKDVFKDNNGELLKKLNVQEVTIQGTLIPMQGGNFTIWFNKTRFNLFPKTSMFYGTTAIDTVIVKEFGVIIGIICPVRHPEPIIDLFDKKLEDKP
jgi:hypothetical protein